MINPISPQFVLIIHKDKERELLNEIEFNRVAKERWAYETAGSLNQKQAWYAQVSEWMKVKLFNRTSASRNVSGQQEPCPGVPC